MTQGVEFNRLMLQIDSQGLLRSFKLDLILCLLHFLLLLLQ